MIARRVLGVSEPVVAGGYRLAMTQTCVLPRARVRSWCHRHCHGCGSFSHVARRVSANNRKLERCGRHPFVSANVHAASDWSGHEIIEMFSSLPSSPFHPKWVGVNAREEEEVGKSRQANCVQQSATRQNATKTGVAFRTSMTSRPIRPKHLEDKRHRKNTAPFVPCDMVDNTAARCSWTANLGSHYTRKFVTCSPFHLLHIERGWPRHGHRKNDGKHQSAKSHSHDVSLASNTM